MHVFAFPSGNRWKVSCRFRAPNICRFRVQTLMLGTACLSKAIETKLIADFQSSDDRMRERAHYTHIWRRRPNSHSSETKTNALELQLSFVYPTMRLRFFTSIFSSFRFSSHRSFVLIRICSANSVFLVETTRCTAHVQFIRDAYILLLGIYIEFTMIFIIVITFILFLVLLLLHGCEIAFAFAYQFTVASSSIRCTNGNNSKFSTKFFRFICADQKELNIQNVIDESFERTSSRIYWRKKIGHNLKFWAWFNNFKETDTHLSVSKWENVFRLMKRCTGDFWSIEGDWKLLWLICNKMFTFIF